MSKYSAIHMLQELNDKITISTKSHELDLLLGGQGLVSGRLLEVAGLPGIGKTQLGMQLCLNVQLPMEKGGARGEAIYIDTEGSFLIKRLLEMVEPLVQEMHSYGQTRDYSIHQFLERIHVFRVHSYQEQMALISELNSFLSIHTKVKLIVLDSVAFHFRQNTFDLSARSRLLNQMAQMFRQYADQYNLAILLTNQMTTKVVYDEDREGQSVLVPALGESWGHCCTERIILFWQNSKRKAWLAKSPNLCEKIVSFAITNQGIRDDIVQLNDSDSYERAHKIQKMSQAQ